MFTINTYADAQRNLYLEHELRIEQIKRGKENKIISRICND